MQIAVLLLALQQLSLRTGADTLEAANVVNGQARHMGTMVRAVARAGEFFLITTTFSSARGGTSFDTLAVDARTLAPRWQRVHFATDSAAVQYAGGRVAGYSHQAGQALRRIDRKLPAGALPAALTWQIVKSRNWRTGYAVNEYDLWQDTTARVSYRASRRRTIQHRGKPVDVWIIQDNRGSIHWIDAVNARLIMLRDRGHLLVRR